MKKPTILILHGWGAHGGKYHQLVQLLKQEGFTPHAPDLPGFGREKLRKRVMHVDGYVEFVEKFIKEKNLNNVIIIAHSFGGRIAIKLAAVKIPQLRALILTGSAGIKSRLTIPKRIGMYVAITAGELFRFPMFLGVKDKLRKLLYFAIGEWDYYNSGDLRETFKKVVAEDLTSYLPKIKVPTLLVWGEKDIIIPRSDGMRMKELIPNATLVVVKGATHKLPYAMPHVFLEKILPFLRANS